MPKRRYVLRVKKDGNFVITFIHFEKKMKRKKRHRVFFIHNDHYTRKQLLSKSCEYPVTFSNIFFVMLSAWNNTRDSVQKKKKKKKKKKSSHLPQS